MGTGHFGCLVDSVPLFEKDDCMDAGGRVTQEAVTDDCMDAGGRVTQEAVTDDCMDAGGRAMQERLPRG
jgi:hypothetical protein